MNIRSLSKIIAATLLAATFLGGCASTPSLAQRGLLPEVQARRPPEVPLGPELALLNEPVKLSIWDPGLVLLTSFIGKDGRAHVFATDHKKQLHHIEVLADAVVKAELLGVIDKDKDVAIDAVEQPAGKLRVLVGDKQFIRSASDSVWQELKGNRCEKFLPLKDDLYCAFVIKGEEVDAPRRTDYTIGGIVIIPWISWSTKHAEKLVVAQASVTEGSGPSWTIRAVVDPETPEDADRNFMAGVDNQGTFHFLYLATRGSRGFYIGAAPGGLVGGAAPFTPSELRYAQVALDHQPSSDSQNQESASEKTSKGWLSVAGAPLPQPRRLNVHSVGNVVGPFVFEFTRLLQKRALNKASGEISGLVCWSTEQGADQVLGVRPCAKLMEYYPLWLEAGIRDGRWLSQIHVVAAQHLPDSTYDWGSGTGLGEHTAIIKADSSGNLHALLGFVQSNSEFVGYLVKSGNNWSAPVTLGNLARYTLPRTLAVGDSGDVFAAWVNKDGKFVGRWIRPQK